MSSKGAEFLQKPQSIRYSGSFEQELYRQMGAYSFFLTNKQYERAFWNLWLSCLHVLHDPQKRIFKVGAKDQQDEWKNENKFMKHLVQFAELFGLKPTRDGKFSYLDLKPRDKPEPEHGKVYISKMVRFFDLWGRYDYDQLIHTFRFVYVEKKVNAQGFPYELVKPAISFQDPKKLLKYFTNVMPYPTWEQEVKIVVPMLTEEAKILEITIAEGLYNANIPQKEAVVQENNGLVMIDLMNQGPGGFDYPSAPQPDPQENEDPGD